MLRSAGVSKTAFGVVGLAALFAVTGCGSVISAEKSTGLTTLATWKATADQVVRDPSSADQGEYNAAKAAVAGVIANFETRVDAAGSSPLGGTADLRDEQIPQATKDAVAAAFGRAPQVTAEEVANFIAAQIDAARKASAEAVKAKLKEFQWRDWPTQ